jgi:two-component system chemotaxis response regulator CheB
VPKIRVLVIDDSVVIRRLVSDALASDPEIEIAGIASDGRIGLARIEQLNPDIVTLDIEMPVMNGLETVAAIRKTHPRLPVIMFSTLTERGASATLDALSLGANDYVTKPANVGSVNVAVQRIRDELIPKIKALCRRTAPKPAAPLVAPARPAWAPSTDQPEILAIGVSTGGPNALSALIPQLAPDLGVPVVIVQHMPPLFTRLLAERISAVSAFPAREGVAGTLLEPGQVWIAPGGLHMEVRRTPDGVRIVTHDGPPENSCRPAVDVLFRSVADAYGARSLAVVLTGMGQDGLRGCQTLREAGGRILAQDEATSVVWGMPGAVVHAGLADKVLSLSELAREINRLIPAGLKAP